MFGRKYGSGVATTVPDGFKSGGVVDGGSRCGGGAGCCSGGLMVVAL
jgi:hypothetical protein